MFTDDEIITGQCCCLYVRVSVCARVCLHLMIMGLWLSASTWVGLETCHRLPRCWCVAMLLCWGKPERAPH